MLRIKHQWQFSWKWHTFVHEIEPKIIVCKFPGSLDSHLYFNNPHPRRIIINPYNLYLKPQLLLRPAFVCGIPPARQQSPTFITRISLNSGSRTDHLGKTLMSIVLPTITKFCNLRNDFQLSLNPWIKLIKFDKGGSIKSRLLFWILFL